MQQIKLTKQQADNIKMNLVMIQLELEKRGRSGETITIKTAEVELQNAIEKAIPEQCWWEVTTVDIYSDLISCGYVAGTVRAIINSLEVKV